MDLEREASENNEKSELEIASLREKYNKCMIILMN